MATQLGIKIRAERKRLNLTLDKLAELTDSSKSYIWALENNDDANPTADKLSKLADALNVTVEFLLNDGQALTELDSKNVFYRRYEKLTSDKQAAINAVLDALERESKS